jgi:hypothetical protein
MQSLGQAVFGYVGYNSREGRKGIGRNAIIREMRRKGYLEPLCERVDSALRGMLEPVSETIHSGVAIVKINGKYFNKRAYLRATGRANQI